MSKRRVVIDLSCVGWLGWLAFGLLALPLLILSLFFFAAMLTLISVLVLAAIARLYWLKYKARTHAQRPETPAERLPPPPA